MKQALREIASTAARKGYSAEDVQDANFAVVAFLDESVLTAYPCAAEWAPKESWRRFVWARFSGEVFFNCLETLRANFDSKTLVEVLEVYYLCTLLGCDGKFAGSTKREFGEREQKPGTVEALGGRTLPPLRRGPNRGGGGASEGGVGMHATQVRVSAPVPSAF